MNELTDMTEKKENAFTLRDRKEDTHHQDGLTIERSIILIFNAILKNLHKIKYI